MALSKVEACVAEVADWMEKNQLKLNKEKSEAVIFLTAKQRVDLPAEVSLTVAGHRVIRSRLCAIWTCCTIAE